MGLFSRKRPSIYKWDDSWALVSIVSGPLPNKTLWSWTCPDDYYYQLLSLSYSFTMRAFIHNVLLFWSLDEAQYRLMTWGFRTWLKDATLIQTHQRQAQRNLVSSASNDWSFGDLPDHCYIKPGQTLNGHCDTIGTNDNYNYVALRLKRWSYV